MLTSSPSSYCTLKQSHHLHDGGCPRSIFVSSRLDRDKNLGTCCRAWATAPLPAIRKLGDEIAATEDVQQGTRTSKGSANYPPPLMQQYSRGVVKHWLVPLHRTPASEPVERNPRLGWVVPHSSPRRLTNLGSSRHRLDQLHPGGTSRICASIERFCVFVALVAARGCHHTASWENPARLFHSSSPHAVIFFPSSISFAFFGPRRSPINPFLWPRAKRA